MSTPSVAYFKSQLYFFHIFTVALPLLYYGIRGKLGHKPDEFGYTYLTLLGGMALFYHDLSMVTVFMKYGIKSFFIWNQ